jgi:hypothetical protein
MILTGSVALSNVNVRSCKDDRKTCMLHACSYSVVCVAVKNKNMAFDANELL